MNNLYIEVIQLSGDIETGSYFWMLKNGKEQIASSEKITHKRIIEKEAMEIAQLIGCRIIVSERNT